MRSSSRRADTRLRHDPAVANPWRPRNRLPWKAGLRPISIVLDGTNSRTSINFPAVQASSLQVRWTPANGSDPITVRELASFGALSLNDYEVAANPESVAERRRRARAKTAKIRRKSRKGRWIRRMRRIRWPQLLSGLTAGRSPYLPGALGFPPNTNFRGFATPGNSTTAGTACGVWTPPQRRQQTPPSARRKQITSIHKNASLHGLAFFL